MDAAHNDLLRRPLYFYDLPAEILATLTFTGNPKALDKPDDHPLPSKAKPDETTQEASELLGSQSCAFCGLSFPSLQEQRSHLKSDLHHYNLKQKLRGHKPVSEEEFEKLVEDLDESLSGSDSDTEPDDEEDGDDSTLAALLRKQANVAQSAEAKGPIQAKTRQPGNSPLLWLACNSLPENHYFGAYKAIFSQEELQDAAGLVNVIKKKQLAPITLPKQPKDGLAMAPVAHKSPHIFLCMIGGGHFAAMVVSLAPRQNPKGTTMDREATVLAHKTFHRYTTRRKQGGSQSANDNAKGKAKSIGAQIRRANEQALIDDIRSLLVDWKPLIDTAELIFIRATGAQNRRVLFGEQEDQVLKSKDPRIRGFPFSTGRATQRELMRCFIELTRLKIREIVPVEAEPQSSEPSGAAAPKPSKPKTLERDEEAETALLHTSQIQSMIKRTKLPALLAYLRNNKLGADFRFAPADSQANVHAPTPLHLSSSVNAAVIVSGLLTKAGADPTILNRDGKTPFELAGDRETRDAFRVARGEVGEDRWNWEAAKVPPAISKQDAKLRIEREKAEEAARRQSELKRLEQEGPKVESTKPRTSALATAKGPSWEEEAKGMTPEMRMRLQREQRARAAEERLRRLQQG